VTTLLGVMQESVRPLSYEEMRRATGATGDKYPDLRGGLAYDQLLYILAAWQAVGLVRRIDTPDVNSPTLGRPRYLFEWIGDKVLDFDLARAAA
jgi:hypothetical protein